MWLATYGILSRGAFDGQMTNTQNQSLGPHNSTKFIVDVLLLLIYTYWIKSSLHLSPVTESQAERPLSTLILLSCATGKFWVFAISWIWASLASRARCEECISASVYNTTCTQYSLRTNLMSFLLFKHGVGLCFLGLQFSMKLGVLIFLKLYHVRRVNTNLHGLTSHLPLRLVLPNEDY